MDLVVRVKRFPRPGETITREEISEHTGGKGSDQASAAVRAAPTALIASFGSDSFGRTMR